MAKQRKLGKKLDDFAQEEREAEERDRDRQPEDLDFSEDTPDPVPEDEYYGGFRPDDEEDYSSQEEREEDEEDSSQEEREEERRKEREEDGRYWGEFSRSGRPKAADRGWAGEPPRGLIDGQTPDMFRRLDRGKRWPAWRLIDGQPPDQADAVIVPSDPRVARRNSPHAAIGNNFPFARQLVKLAEQQRPTVTPERDRADELERQEKRQARLEEWTDPNAGPSAAFARGIRHEECAWFLSRHTARRVQALLLRQYKPSAKLEAKRLPVLKRVATNPLLTKEYLNRSSPSDKNALRAYGVVEVAKFFAKGGHVHFCPPEKAAKMLDKRGVRHLLSHVTRTGGTILVTAVPSKKKTPARKMGRPPVYERPMTAAERKARERAMQVKAPAPNRRPRPDADRRPHPPPAASGSFFSEGTVWSLSSRVTRSGNMIHVQAVPTPRRSKEPLIGEIMISCKPKTSPPVPEIYYRRHCRDGLMAYVAGVIEEQLRAVAKRRAA